MAEQSFYIGPNNEAKRNITDGNIPMISQDLDSVRAYQFEIHFNVPNDTGLEDGLILAAKQVTAAGMSTEDIEVHRVNDKVYYPGKASPEELTVTFDNIYNQPVAENLWGWFRNIYDPITGKFNMGGNSFKAGLTTILHMGPQGQVLSETKLYGLYPKSWKTAEFNYSTNEFHTIEMVFRYDFMEHTSGEPFVGPPQA
jgi:hypothetical protein